MFSISETQLPGNGNVSNTSLGLYVSASPKVAPKNLFQTSCSLLCKHAKKPKLSSQKTMSLCENTCLEDTLANAWCEVAAALCAKTYSKSRIPAYKPGCLSPKRHHRFWRAGRLSLSRVGFTKRCTMLNRSGQSAATDSG